MVYPPDNMALLRLATKATKQYAPVVKGAKDLRNMVSKYSADLKFSDVTKIRTGHQSKSYYLFDIFFFKVIRVKISPGQRNIWSD